jgi:hypothetical protein
MRCQDKLRRELNMLFIKRLGLLVLIVVGSILGATSPAHAVYIDFQTPIKDVTLGSTVSMELRFSSFPDPQSLANYDLEVAYNSTILGFSAVTFGDPVFGDQLNQDGLASQTVLGPYALAMHGFSAVNLLESASSVPVIPLGEYRLATLSFSTLTAGPADLWINVNDLLDPSGRPLDLLYTGIGQITVTSPPPTTVPEPETLLLVVFGIGCMLVSSHRLVKRF